MSKELQNNGLENEHGHDIVTLVINSKSLGTPVRFTDEEEYTEEREEMPPAIWLDRDYQEGQDTDEAQTVSSLEQLLETELVETEDIEISLEETIKQFINTYPGGFAAFEKDFENQFISRIEKPTAKPNVFGKLVGYAIFPGSAFHALSALSINEVNNLWAVENEPIKASFLVENQINEEELNAWLEVLALWHEGDRLAFTAYDRFDVVTRVAFIEHLKHEQDV